MAADRSRPAWVPLVASAIVVPSVLAGLTLLWPRPQIEDGLTRAGGAALAAAGIPGTPALSGRDATISGVPAADRQRAIDTVAGVTGVRVATAADAGGAPAQPPAAAPATTAPASTAPATTGAAPTSAAPAPGAGELDAAAKQQLEASVAALLSAAPVTFQPDSPQLTAQGRATVAKVLAIVTPLPARLQVDGFVATGPGDGRLTAQQLSDQRAAAVRDALVAGGVPADRVVAAGKGEDTSATDRALGRRADITVV